MNLHRACVPVCVYVRVITSSRKSYLAQMHGRAYGGEVSTEYFRHEEGANS